MNQNFKMGISIARVETKVEKWMTCYLCDNLIEKISVLSCEHYFCVACIIQFVSWVKEEEKCCPECSKSANVGEFPGPNLFIKRLGYKLLTCLITRGRRKP